ncbi:MAG: YegS/Rv2252/BmrU family lipid kinase [Clostridia bacterium]|nr:YegS/Rv2252/BmrU family lipid kinase [Clostridia bacterium]
MKEKLLLLINPVSGDGAARLWLYDMVDILSKRFSPVSVFVSRAAGEISNAAAQNAKNYDAVICAGGDGTLSEMLDGIVKSGASPLLGYIPMGTINDFATSHGISKNVKTALNDLVAGKEKIYDLGVLNDRAFSYVAAFGAFTDVAYQTAQDAKSSFGILAYLTEAAKRLPKLMPIEMTYTVNGKSETGEFIYGMASNSKSVGGIKFFGTADDEMLTDGLFEVTLVRFPRGADKLYNAIRGLLTPNLTCDEVIRIRASSVNFRFAEDTPWTVDGEFGGTFREVEAHVLPSRIRLIV